MLGFELLVVLVTIGHLVGLIIGVSAIGGIAAYASIEYQYRRRPGNHLTLTPGTWNFDVMDSEHYVLVGHLEFQNLTRRFEIMVPEVTVEATVLSDSGRDIAVSHHVQIISEHADADNRQDRYWPAYIVKVGKTTGLKLILDIKGDDLSLLQSVWLKVRFITYGPQGRIPKVRHIVIPLSFPDTKSLPLTQTTRWSVVQPIRTHLLSHLDDPVELVQRYVVPHAQPGDIVAIGETPLAIMQGQWRHPTDIHPGWLAKRLCYYFMPTSSLATACGLQTLVDLVGPWRVLYAFIGGAIAKKFLGRPGMFYELAGEQARLIDDVTGTLPPYDQFIVLGPQDPQKVVEHIQQETGLGVAIVDVNDLRAVKVLAATADVSLAVLENALISNPAGNGDEQTPIVLIHRR